MPYDESDTSPYLEIDQNAITYDPGISPVFKSFWMALIPVFGRRGIHLSLKMAEIDDEASNNTESPEIAERMGSDHYLDRSQFGSDLEASILLRDLLYARLDGNLDAYLLQNVVERLQERGRSSAHVSEDELIVSVAAPSGIEAFRFEFPLNRPAFEQFFARNVS